MPQNTPRGYTYPLYGDPTNFPAQIQDFATDVDTDVQALQASITSALNAPSCRIIASANQNVNANTLTFATFATEEYDNAAMGNLGVNNDRISFTQLGIYLVSGSVTFASNGNAAVNGREMSLQIGGLNVGTDNRPGSQNIPTELSVTFLHQISVGGLFMRMEVVQASGAALNITTRSMTATRMAV